MGRDKIPKMQQVRDRRDAIEVAVEVLADYLWAWGNHEEKGRTAWAVSVPQSLRLDVELDIETKLAELWRESAKEQSLEEKANQLGMKY